MANITTGGYTVSDITANASAPGAEYFGSVVNGSSSVVVPAQPTVDLGFSLVDLAAPVGTVTFHAGGTWTGRSGPSPSTAPTTAARHPG